MGFWVGWSRDWWGFGELTPSFFYGMVVGLLAPVVLSDFTELRVL